jgi:hypothetical protein
MNNLHITLTSVMLLSGIAFLTGIARLMLDMRFVPEVMNAMPETQPLQTGGVMLFFIVIFAGWLWALLAANRNSRGGLWTLLMFNLVIVLIWGLSTLLVFCPTPCWVAAPLTDIVTWANVIVGLLATIATGLYLNSGQIIGSEALHGTDDQHISGATL